MITIGRIVKVWGLKGEVKVLPFTHNSERFERLFSALIVSPEGKEQKRKIRGVRYIKDSVILSLEGIESAQQAKALVDNFIKIPESDLEPLPEGEYYIFQLIGVEVFTDQGVRIGIIADIFSTGSSDIYVVTEGNKEYLVPAIRDIVKEIDIERRRMVIHPIEGLLD